MEKKNTSAPPFLLHTGRSAEGMGMWKVAMTALCFLLLLSVRLYARPVGTFYEYVQRDSVGKKGAELVFYAPALSRYIPHIMRQYEHAKAMHTHSYGG